jgi:hypothetical protein
MAPSEAILERLDDPAVAASLVTILDNAELLSTLVLGLSGFVERGDTIMDAVAEGMHDIKSSGVIPEDGSYPSLSEAGVAVSQLVASGPALTAVLESSMVRPETINLLSDISEAATEGAAVARENNTSVSGLRGALKLLRDPEVQRGLGVLAEIARSLGRRMS